jgi:hypothetical protein
MKPCTTTDLWEYQRIDGNEEQQEREWEAFLSSVPRCKREVATCSEHTQGREVSQEEASDPMVPQ